ncbi:hypothetical protein ACQEWB_13510 [Streptomyces sp. CA-249302]|uniref:hypothetical protein n=1 Tax=Streptomyces sp. CA-249302 TaxID=3240058 RepID=UPI003D902A50
MARYFTSPAVRYRLAITRPVVGSFFFSGAVIASLMFTWGSLPLWLNPLLALAGWLGLPVALSAFATCTHDLALRRWTRPAVERQLDRWLEQSLDAVLATAAPPVRRGSQADAVPVPETFRVHGIDYGAHGRSRLGTDRVRRFETYVVVVVRQIPGRVFTFRYELDMRSGAFRGLGYRSCPRDTVTGAAIQVSGRQTGACIRDCSQGSLPVIRWASWKLGPDDDLTSVIVDLCVGEDRDWQRAGTASLRARAEQVCREMATGMP